MYRLMNYGLLAGVVAWGVSLFLNPPSCLAESPSEFSAQVDYFLSPALEDIAYVRPDKHDGYVVGNGRMYAVAALGRDLTRSGKSGLTDKKVSLSHISWIIGPTYTLGNLGYGWDIHPVVDGQSIEWQQERVLSPTTELPFWGVRSEHGQISCTLTDAVLPQESVMVRRIVVTRPANLPAATISLRLPVSPDPRNAIFTMFDGKEVDQAQVEQWKYWVGPHIQPRSSLPKEKLQQVFELEKALVHLGAARALYQEMSTSVVADEEYKILFPPRALATTAVCKHQDAKVWVDSSGIHVDLGLLQAGEQRTVAVWMVTVSSWEPSLESLALATLSRWQTQEVDEVFASCRRSMPEPLLTRTDGGDQMVDVINACGDIIRTSQAQGGGVFAQSYMYPMYYVRDQYGSFRLLMSLGDYERAYRVLTFYVAMQNQYGIQNAYDMVPGIPDPNNWDPSRNYRQLDGHHQRAEVPSYIILMARDYYLATGARDKIEFMYPRLAYNLRVQHINPNGLLPYAGDESYTNFADTKPRFEQEMADSTILFIGAADFMAAFAEKTGRPKDAAEFTALAARTRQALMARLWLPQERHYAYARDDSDHPENIDRRPAFDALLRDVWLGVRHPLDPVAMNNLHAVMKHLLDPVRITPNAGLGAGMEPGYLLYAMSCCQHPQTHQAAKLLMRYASDTGGFNEYYFHNDKNIYPNDGTLRPWESSVSGTALIQYLLGLHLDLPAARLELRPHLPPAWRGWQTRMMALPDEGAIQMSLVRGDQETVVFKIQRTGGVRPLTVQVEFGLFGPQLKGQDQKLEAVPGRSDLLRATFTLNPMWDNQQLVFKSLNSNDQAKE